MLVARIITALLLAPLVISGVLYLPVVYFAVIMTVIFTIAAYEWTKISNIFTPYAHVFVISLLGFFAFLWFLSIQSDRVFLAIMLLATLFWGLSLFFISQFPRYQEFWSKNLAIKFIVGYFILIPSWYALILFKDLQLVTIADMTFEGSQLILVMILMIWSADTGAYFSGRQWGKVKLIPNVSPGKTRAGVYGALISTSLMAMIFCYFVISDNALHVFYAFLVALIIVVVSVIGDLFESMYKRYSGIKDSGNILPGHGGILDRLDSLTSVAPIFYMLVYIIAG